MFRANTRNNKWKQESICLGSARLLLLIVAVLLVVAAGNTKHLTGNDDTHEISHVEINQKWSWQSQGRDGEPVKEVAVGGGNG
ncbi:hypothetical protein SK128_020108 [Halocaridina rubra]|uniref:Uncharacterized protein n=1 Tax=Halocaridina rubra TaxID=373956 RepID=A0AAN8ZVB6_HALRR